LMENDYRDVYASVLLQWFGTTQTKAQEVLLRDFSPGALPLFKTSTTSVNDGEASPAAFVSVGPNPATDHVVVRARVDAHSTSSLTLSNLRGIALRNVSLDSWTGVGTVDLTGLSQGTYLLTLRSDRAVTHTFVQISR